MLGKQFRKRVKRDGSWNKVLDYERPKNAPAISFPFIIGNKLNSDPYIELVIDRSTLPKYVEVFLNPFDKDNYFPALDNTQIIRHISKAAIKFLDQTKLLLSTSHFKGIVTLEKGSTFEDVMDNEDKITIVSEHGCEWVTQTDKRLIAIRSDSATIGIQKQPRELIQMSLNIHYRDNIEPKSQYQITVSQRNTKGQVVGGVSSIIEA